MNIEYSYRSCVHWDKNYLTPFKAFESIGGHLPTLIEINNSSKYWQMEFCHELAHIYLAERFSMDRYNDNAGYRLRIEMMAHRVAKSFCKFKYWDEKNALKMVEFYINQCDSPVNMDKMKKNGIIPLNKGMRLKAEQPK